MYVIIERKGLFFKSFFGDKMEQKKFDFWQDHSAHYLKIAFRTDRREMIKHPDGYGKRTGDCGDIVEMYLTVRNGCIRSVSFETNGCLSTNACANTVAQLAEGRKVEDAWEITPEDVIDYLETLPPENTHCAELVVGAFYLALRNYQEFKRDSWKKPYRGK
jgi:nitrogen fixation NifU-like protein